MNILHINNYEKKGGAETVFNISRRPYDNVKIVSGFVQSDGGNSIPDIPFRSWEINSQFAGAINYIFSLHNFLLLRNYLNNNHVDIIHLHGFFSAISPSILLAIKMQRRKRKLTVVQTIHDYHLICPNSSLYNNSRNEICEKCIGKKLKLSIFTDKCDRRGILFSIIKGVRSLVSNSLLRHRDIVDKFICPSEFLARKLAEDNIPVTRIELLRNPVTLELPENFQKKGNLICYFGRFSREKNLGFLIEAFLKWKRSDEKGFRLLLIGEGEEEVRLRQMTGKNEDIIFKPFMPQDLLFEEVSKARIFCLSSSCYENAPMTILEAASLGVIPLVPDLGGMKEIIEQVIKCGKTYERNNAVSWSESLQDILNNYESELSILKNSMQDIDKLLNDNKYRIDLHSLYKGIR
ncbi:MAG: glycosyltransferase family 4 protein [Melioribacteraceae bacterium]|nr:glycosyltransferase family 4 protein [Melioribacteraceae bacterium]